MKYLSFYKLLLLLLCILPNITGCIERSIDPFEDGAGYYSIYGSLDIDKNIHYIRVNDVQSSVIGDPDFFDLSVTFHDLETENSVELRDTLVDFSGFISHNFIFEQKLDPRKHYKLTVQNAEGLMATSSVRTPGITGFDMEPKEITGCETQITFTFKNVKRPEHVQMEVGFFHDGDIRWSRIGLVGQLNHRENTDEMFVSMSPRNLLVEVFPPANLGTNPRFARPTVSCNQLHSDVVHIRYKHFGPEWEIFSTGFFPINPLEWQDVENGLGFLGAFREDSTAFTIHLPTD